MSQRRPIHDKLFRAIVVMGAALGTAACVEHGSKPPTPDAKIADAGPPNDGVTVDVIAIL